MTMLKITSAECRAELPAVLIDYLWKLAAENGTAHQTFTLTAKTLGEDEVQDIWHRSERYSAWSRVFGYKPVTAMVEIRQTDMGYLMALQNTAKREMGWMPCSA